MKKKEIKDMSDEELVQAYVTGSNWLIDKQQVSGTEVNRAGEKYNHKEFMYGLGRLEKIETEMQIRGVAY